MPARVERARVPVGRWKFEAEARADQHRPGPLGSRAVANSAVGVEPPAVGVTDDTHSTNVAATNADAAEAKHGQGDAVADPIELRGDVRGAVVTSLETDGIVGDIDELRDRRVGGVHDRKGIHRIVIAIPGSGRQDRKSTRLNSSHLVISYAVFCLKKKKYSPTRRSRAD